MPAAGADIPSARSRSSRRTSKQCLAAICIAAASAATIALQIFWGSNGCDTALSPSSVTSASLLQPVTHAEVRSIDWKACLEPKSADQPMTKEQFLQEEPARLRLEHLRLSTLASPVGATVVVAYDAARLSMLDGVCSTWGGHISAAVYGGPRNGSIVSAASIQIDDIWARAEASRTCALDVAVYSEVVAEGDPWISWLFPVNALRSRALLLARSELVVVLDGDMLLHSALHRSLADSSARYNALVEGARNRVYHVLPALQAQETSDAYASAQGTKAYTVSLMDRGVVTRFNPTHAYPQACTDYAWWREAKEPYRVEYCRRYEPWGIVSRRLMPWFDVRFRGYGRNKIVFTAALNASGFAFEVDQESFIVHRPHPPSEASFAFSTDAQLQGFIVGMHLKQARDGVYNPALDETIESCRASLPWWQ